MNRIVAILHNNNDMHKNVQKLISSLNDSQCFEKIYVFSYEDLSEFNISDKNCQNIILPNECDNVPKIRNYINTKFKSENFNGMLHVLEDTTEIIENPSTFLKDIENMMDVMDYDVWFSTICDPCNFVYQKYNPRLRITLDRAEYFKLNLGKSLLYTSHSNTQWIIYNFAKISDNLLKFNENFSIAMFYIIEFLARRRNTRNNNQLYFMNQYMTVESEYRVFKNVLDKPKQDSSKELKKEDAIFKELNINYSPDNSIDLVLELTYKKLKEKI